ncbi:MAG: MBL fold metallo-hydrolase, partial [Cetobacterium sp.]
MDVKILATGSDGNCCLVVDNGSVILIDVGFSTQKKTKEMLEPVLVKYKKIDAILISHAHGDHLSNWTGRFAMDNDIPLYISKEHYSEKKLIHDDKKNNIIREAKCIFIEENQTIFINETKIKIVKALHSALAQTKGHFTFGFILNERFGFLSDAGFISNKIKKAFMDLETLALEFNYYTDMLLTSERHFKDKLRNLGTFGHLSNEESKKFVTMLNKNGKIKRLITLHPSNRHNDLEKLKSELSEIGIEEV